MLLWHAVILGVVQGLGEFLPISSSAHLWILPWLFKWPYAGLTFDIALHLGTLIAVVAYFWRDWWTLVISGVRDVHSQEGRLFWYLVAATIPGAIAGLLLEDYAENLFRQPVLIGVALIIMGAVLLWADRKGYKVLELENLRFRAAIIIGLSQALAIIPGVSRSGITMSAGLLTGLTRESAARFSFLLSTPIIFGAALVKVPDLIANPAMMDLSFFIGIIVSCLVGLLSIGFLLRFLQTRNFLPFAWYRFALGALIILVALVR